MRLGLAASLRLAGVSTVAHAEDLTGGVEAVRRFHASLLVLGAAGDAVAEPLGRQIGRLGSTRVVVLVSSADRSTLVALLEAGADGVALRTIVPEDLSALVRRVLAGERSVGPALMSVLLDLAREHAVPVGPDAERPGAVADVTLPTTPLSPPAPLGRLRPVNGVGLTSKEWQVLSRLAHGESNAEIASALYVSPATVKTHLTHIYGKLGVGSRHGALSRAVALGLLQ